VTLFDDVKHKLPNRVPGTVDSVVTRAQAVKMGLWFPTGSFHLAFQSVALVSNQRVNPWLPSLDKYGPSFFTSCLPRYFATEGQMDWAMTTCTEEHPSSSDRGNLAISKQFLMKDVSALSKSQFLAFGSLRAFPYLQITQILGALSENKLPFRMEAVCILCQQALYQVGTLTFDATQRNTLKMRMKWKTELDSGYSVCLYKQKQTVLSLIKEKLKDLLGIVATTASECGAVLFLAMMYAYIIEIDPPSAMDLTEQIQILSDHALSHAAKLDEQSTNVPKTEVPSIKKEQAIFYAVALLACAGFPHGLTMDQARRMVKISVLLEHGKSFVQPHKPDAERSDVSTDLLQLRYRCYWLMIRRSSEIHKCLQQNPGLILDYAIGNIIHHPEQIPKTWHESRTMPGVYHSSVILLDGKEVIVSVNPILGFALLNGRPVCSLPATIRSHSLFVRVFGPDADFEVDSVRAQTISPFNGFHYRFELLPTGSDAASRTGTLRIFEYSEDDLNSRETELLDDSAIDSWAPDMPAILRRHYSHWAVTERKPDGRLPWLCFVPSTFSRRAFLTFTTRSRWTTSTFATMFQRYCKTVMCMTLSTKKPM